jgi:hypothetical protein
VPADISNAAAEHERPYAVHARQPVIRPSDADLDEIAAILNGSDAITIYAGAGCAGAHDEVVATAERLKAPMAHTSRGKDFVAHDNPYNVGMTGLIGQASGYHAVLDCDVLLQLGADFAWPQFYPDKAKIVQIDLDPTHIGHRHPVTFGAVGNIKATLEALLPRLRQHEDNSFLDSSVRRFHKIQESAKAETAGPDSTISGTYLTKLINKHAAKDALFAADDGRPTRIHPNLSSLPACHPERLSLPDSLSIGVSHEFISCRLNLLSESVHLLPQCFKLLEGCGVRREAIDECLDGEVFVLAVFCGSVTQHAERTAYSASTWPEFRKKVGAADSINLQSCSFASRQVRVAKT